MQNPGPSETIPTSQKLNIWTRAFCFMTSQVINMKEFSENLTCMGVNLGMSVCIQIVYVKFGTNALLKHIAFFEINTLG